MKKMTRESWDTKKRPSPAITQRLSNVQSRVPRAFFASGGYLDEFPWNRDGCLADLGC